MENRQDACQPQELILDSASRSLLLIITKWGKLLAIVAFVMLGLILLVTAYQGIWNAFGDRDPMAVTFKLLLKLLFFFPALYLFRFSNKMEAAINAYDQELITASLINLKLLFRFMGILTIIFLVFAIIGIFVIDDGLSFLDKQ